MKQRQVPDKLPVQFRAFALPVSAEAKPMMNMDEAKRTFDLSFSSEDPYLRYFGTEILSHDPACIRMDRMQNGAALLCNHDMDCHIGVVEKAWIDPAEKCARATVRCGMSEMATEKFNDVKDGILRHVSVGYRVHHMTLMESDDETGDTYLVDDWEPLEVSLVAVPADPTVGVGRGLEVREFPVAVTQPVKTAADAPATQLPVAVKPESPADEADPQKEEVRMDTNNAAASTAVEVKVNERANEVDAILAMAKTYNQEAFARKALQDNETLTLGEAKAMVGTEVLKSTRTQQITSTESRMSAKEKQEYSLRRAILAADPKNHFNCMEREISDELYKEMSGKVEGIGGGILVPTQLPGPTNIRSGALDNSAATYGKETIATQTMTLIEFLRVNLIAKQLGIRMLTGLQGNVSFPRQTAITSSSWAAFRNTSTETFPTFDNVTMTPKRNTSATRWDIGFLRQTTLDAEAFVRDDIGIALAKGVDYAIFNGSGVSPVPKGVIPSVGASQKTAYDSNAVYAKVVAMQTALAKANALQGKLAYVATPSMRGLLKQTAKLANTIGLPVWDKDECDGYPAFVSNNLPTDLGSNSPTPNEHGFVFGDWSQVVFGEWGAVEIIVDPYTRAGYGEYLINASLLADIGIRHIEAFNLMTGYTG